jgi:hypothetical protein
VKQRRGNDKDGQIVGLTIDQASKHFDVSSLEIEGLSNVLVRARGGVAASTT